MSDSDKGLPERLDAALADNARLITERDDAIFAGKVAKDSNNLHRSAERKAKGRLNTAIAERDDARARIRVLEAERDDARDLVHDLRSALGKERSAGERLRHELEYVSERLSELYKEIG